MREYQRIGVFAIATLICATAATCHAGEQAAKKLRTAPVTRGDLVITVSATGTVEPEEVIDVGAQVAGPIASFGKDADGKVVDFRSPVEEGTVLAKIDDTVYKTDLDQAETALRRAQAELAVAKAKLDLATASLRKAQQANADVERARSECVLAKAAVGVADAGIGQAEAALRRAKLNLEHTVIRSPVKGEIIDRRVNVGQMIVASLNAPSLFLIATDLSKVQVWTSVNEADIGQVREGQGVTFTVDARRGQVFKGRVAKVRLNATMTQNVVTYTVVIATDNSERLLLPYLTANVEIEVARRANVLLVPTVALRWQPSDAQRERDPKRHRVWIEDGQQVRPIEVQVGASNGSMTEITGGDVKEGMRVIVSGRFPLELRGQGPEGVLERRIASMGRNLLLVLPVTPASGGVSWGGNAPTLTLGDYQAIVRDCPTVAAAAPILRGRVQQIVHGKRNWVPTSILGTTPDYLDVRDWNDLADGKMLTEQDVRVGRNVCVIGQTVARELFEGDSPIGKELRCANVTLTVIGVLDAKGANAMGMDQDDTLLVPWTTMKRRLSGALAAGRASSGPDSVDQIMVRATSKQEIPAAIQQITGVLRSRHRIGDGVDDFTIRDMIELTDVLRSVPRAPGTVR